MRFAAITFVLVGVAITTNACRTLDDAPTCSGNTLPLPTDCRCAAGQSYSYPRCGNEYECDTDGNLSMRGAGGDCVDAGDQDALDIEVGSSDACMPSRATGCGSGFPMVGDPCCDGEECVQEGCAEACRESFACVRGHLAVSGIVGCPVDAGICTLYRNAGDACCSEGLECMQSGPPGVCKNVFKCSAGVVMIAGVYDCPADAAVGDAVAD